MLGPKLNIFFYFPIKECLFFRKHGNFNKYQITISLKALPNNLKDGFKIKNTLLIFTLTSCMLKPYLNTLLYKYVTDVYPMFD